MINFHPLLTPVFNLMFLSPSGRPHGPTLMHEGVPFRAIHHIFEKKKKRQRERVEEGYRCGRWAFLTALTAVRDERPFRAGNDLTSPVGGKPSLTSAPTASSILGHFERPQRGSGVTADQQGGEKNQNMDGAVSSRQSKRL